MMQFKCFLFDLDGTLIDSRADLTNSINLMLQALGRPMLPTQEVLGFVGEGMRLLVERSLRASEGREPQEADILQAMKTFAEIYRAHLLDETALYPEVRDTINALEGMPLAVVTNKPYRFSVEILAGLQMLDKFKAVIGGDSGPTRKPEPHPLWAAAEACSIKPEKCLMIGDTRIDILAGRAAGMKTCGYVPGFRGEEELRDAQADFLINRFGELLSWARREQRA